MRISDWSSDVCSSDLLSPIYLGDYVTIDSGTGVVHSAPAYGIEDFVSCKAHGLAEDQIISPVMGDGHYAESLPLFAGQTIWQANTALVQALKLAGTLLTPEHLLHSNMPYWIHKTQIIYRTT